MHCQLPPPLRQDPDERREGELETSEEGMLTGASNAPTGRSSTPASKAAVAASGLLRSLRPARWCACFVCGGEVANHILVRCQGVGARSASSARLASHRWCGASVEARVPFRAATVRSHGVIARTYCSLAERASPPAALLPLPDSFLAMRPGSTKELGNCSSPRSAGKWHSSAEMLATDACIRDPFFVILPRASPRQVLRPGGTCLLQPLQEPGFGDGCSAALVSQLRTARWP